MSLSVITYKLVCLIFFTCPVVLQAKISFLGCLTVLVSNTGCTDILQSAHSQILALVCLE